MLVASDTCSSGGGHKTLGHAVRHLVLEGGHKTLGQLVIHQGHNTFSVATGVAN